MEKPRDTNLPLFVYGLFKPDELAYGQISRFVDGEPIGASVSGSLYVRDGLPLLKLDSTGGPISGYVLRFGDGDAAYGIVSDFEEGKHYQWETCIPSGSGGPANVLVGRRPAIASVRYERSEWRSDQDPVFVEGMQVVREMSEAYGAERFPPAPPGSFDWPRFFQLRMAYLLLWAVLERYTALAYGPQLRSQERWGKLARSGPYGRAFDRVSGRVHALFDTRDPGRSKVLNPADATSSLDYYHLARCKLSHRGKGAFKDGEAVRVSLQELLAITEGLLDETVFRGRAADDAEVA